MKRRNFVRSLLVAPAGSAALAAQQKAAPPVPAEAQVTPKPTSPARRRFSQPENVPKLQLVQVDLASQIEQHFFNPLQFAALGKLGNVLVPPLKGRPSAADAGAAEFLDFLISVSPADHQKLYCSGLDDLNSQAGEQFHKPFAELDNTQADAILRPLLVVRPWAEDYPEDPLKHFIARVHEDLQTATVNSREWTEGSKGHPFARGFSRTSGFYWRPIDPITEL
jgi:hypothetical protein